MALGKKLRRYRGWVALAVVVAIAGTVFLMMRSANASEEPTTTYTTSAAETGTLSVTVSGTGNLAISDTTEVWPETAGTVDSVEVDEGDTVKAGDVLFTLDEDDAEAATSKALASYRQAQSGVAQGEAQVAKAESSLASLEARSEQPTNTVTQQEIDAAEAEVASAKASLAASKASQSSALAEYNDALAAEKDLVVTAPVAGRVYTLGVSQGDSVGTSGGTSSTGSTSGGAGGDTSASTTTASGSSAPIVIAGDGPLVATLAINEVDLPSIKVGQRTDLEFDALPDLVMTGKVTEVSDEGTVESGVVSFDVEITLDVANAALKPGMSVSATIVTAVAQDTLLVPNAAVKSDTEGNYVQVLDSSGAPTQVRVEVGMAGDTQTEIVSGLEDGDEAVTATNEAGESEEQAGGPGGVGMMMGGGPGR